jgi:hypothetical protein
MDGLVAYRNQVVATVTFLAMAYNILYATCIFIGLRAFGRYHVSWRTCILYATALDVAVAYNISVRHGCDGSTHPHQALYVGGVYYFCTPQLRP